MVNDLHSYNLGGLVDHVRGYKSYWNIKFQEGKEQDLLVMVKLL